MLSLHRNAAPLVNRRILILVLPSTSLYSLGVSNNTRSRRYGSSVNARKADPKTKSLLKKLDQAESAARPRASQSIRSNNVPFEDRAGPAENSTTQMPPGRTAPFGMTDRASTMTNRERNAFKRLFDSMISTGYPSGRSSLSNEIDRNVPDTTTLFAPQSFRLDAFPLELRAMAARAQRKLGDRHVQPAAEHNLKRDEASLEPEVQRIEKLLNNAQTDHEIWKLLGDNVFEPLKQLDTDIKARSGKPLDAQAPGRQPTPGTETTGHDLKFPSSKKEGSSNPPQNLKIIAMGCSWLFALAMRLLSRRVVYSQYADALLPTIKTDSWTSSILGISTALYNEVLYQTWHSRQDLIAASLRLREMDAAGLDFDHETLQILSDIDIWLHRARNGEFGKGVQSLERLLEREREVAEIRKWKKEVRERLDSMAVENTRRAEAERRLGLEGVLEPQPTTAQI